MGQDRGWLSTDGLPPEDWSSRAGTPRSAAIQSRPDALAGHDEVTGATNAYDSPGVEEQGVSAFDRYR